MTRFATLEECEARVLTRNERTRAEPHNGMIVAIFV